MYWGWWIDDYVALTVNIFLVLNSLLESDYVFSKQKPSDFNNSGRPNATCHYKNDIIILIEFKKRKLVLRLNNDGQLDYYDDKTKNVIK